MIKPPSKRDSFPQIAVALVIAAFVLLHTWELASRSFGMSYYPMWVVGQEIRAGNSDGLYQPRWQAEVSKTYRAIARSDRATANQLVAADSQRLIPTNATPLVYSGISLLSSSNYAHSLLANRIIQFACSLIAITLLCSLLDYSWTATILASTVLWWGWNQPALVDVLTGDVSQSELLLIALILWLLLRVKHVAGEYIAGALFAKFVLLQPQFVTVPILLSVLMIAAHQTRRVIRIGGGFVIAAIALLIFTRWWIGSFHCWSDWAIAARELSTQHPTTISGNCSLMQIVREHLGTAASILFIAITRAGMLILVGWFGRKNLNIDKTFIAISLGCLLPLLVWPIAWRQDFVLAVPAMLLALAPSSDDAQKILIRWSLAALGLLMFLDSPLTNEFIRMDDSQSIAARLSAATMIFFCLAIWQLVRTRIPSRAGLAT